MSIKDSSEEFDYNRFQDSNNAIDNEVPEDENVYRTSQKHKKTSNKITNPFKKSERFLITVGIILICTIALFLFNPFGHSTTQNPELEKLKLDIQTLENKIIKINSIFDRIPQMEQQMIDLQNFYDAYHKRDATLSIQIDLLQKNVTKLEENFEKIKHTATKKPVIPIRPKTKAVTYHVVKKGETFYGISRKYGLTLDTLKKYNKLSEKSVLHPGQKLTVGYK